MPQHTSSRWILVAAWLTTPCLLGNKGCDETPETPNRDAATETACTPEECGPVPGAPNFMCSDGSVGGPGPCGRLASGACGYTLHDCGASDGAGTGQQGASTDGGSVVLACGTRGGVACAKGQFCNFEPDADCGGTDRGGACEPVPTDCTPPHKPVCGCDDQTYPSACVAHAASMSVKHEGACTSPPAQACDGTVGLSCPKDWFCNHEVSAGGQGCDTRVAGAEGVCEARPRACTKELKRVCGCDSKTYSNACTAHRQGLPVLHEGACTEVDCKLIGGHPVDGIGPPPRCPKGEVNFTRIAYSNGNVVREGTACCVPARNP